MRGIHSRKRKDIQTSSGFDSRGDATDQRLQRTMSGFGSSFIDYYFRQNDIMEQIKLKR